MGDTPNWLSLLLCYPVISLRVTGYLRLGQVGGDVANPAINPQCLLVDTCPCVVIWGSFYCWLSTWMILVTCLALFIDWCWFFFQGRRMLEVGWSTIRLLPCHIPIHHMFAYVCLCLLVFILVRGPYSDLLELFMCLKKTCISSQTPMESQNNIFTLYRYHSISNKYPKYLDYIAKIVGIEIYPPVMKRRDGKCPT